MKAFEFYAPTDHIFGEGVVDQVGERLAAAGWKKALIVYGQGSVVKSGLLDKVKSKLDAAGVAYVDLGGVRPNPEVGLVREGIETVMKLRGDWTFDVGVYTQLY